jgi:hypothetical protein
VAGLEVVGSRIVAEMVVVVGYGGGVATEAKDLASAPIGGGSRHYTGALKALPAPC